MGETDAAVQRRRRTAINDGLMMGRRAHGSFYEIEPRRQPRAGARRQSSTSIARSTQGPDAELDVIAKAVSASPGDHRSSRRSSDLRSRRVRSPSRSVPASAGPLACPPLQSSSWRRSALPPRTRRRNRCLHPLGLRPSSIAPVRGDGGAAILRCFRRGFLPLPIASVRVGRQIASTPSSLPARPLRDQA